MNRAMTTVTSLLMALLLLAGCGRKEAPKIVTDTSLKPEIVDLTYSTDIGLLQLNFSLKGNPAGVGFQIDRTELDPYCKCPGFWRRYDESLPKAELLKGPVTKLIAIKARNTEYLFRIRAYDDNGNVGPWSKLIRAQYQDPEGY